MKLYCFWWCHMTSSCYDAINRSVDFASAQVKWRNIHFIMWDIGGQESLRQAWSTYYSGTQFVILVVDSTDRERLAISREELYRMLGNEVSVCVCVCVCVCGGCRERTVGVLGWLSAVSSLQDASKWTCTVCGRGSNLHTQAQTHTRILYTKTQTQTYKYTNTLT